LWERLDIQPGAHLRRIHYLIVDPKTGNNRIKKMELTASGGLVKPGIRMVDRWAHASTSLAPSRAIWPRLGPSTQFFSKNSAGNVSRRFEPTRHGSGPSIGSGPVAHRFSCHDPSVMSVSAPFSAIDPSLIGHPACEPP
jgi:hypothetical protein